MSPVEKVIRVSETTRVSIPVALLLACITGTGAAVATGYTARDQALAIIRQQISESANAQRAERDERLKGYVTREEMYREVVPRLVRIESKMDRK